MSARRVASTALAAVLVLLVPAGAASAEPPVCITPAQQTTVTEFELVLDAFEYCSDPDSELAFEISVPATNGTAVEDDGFLLYTSNPGYTGPDGFSFTASDGTDTITVVVSITVTANQAPTCPPTLTYVTPFGTALDFDPWFDCADDSLIETFDVIDPPDHGALTPYDFVDGFTYTPAAGYQGSDSFVVVAKDHLDVASNQLTITVMVLAPNRAPTCVTPATVRVPVGGRTPLDHRRACTDPDGDEMTATIVTFPAHGRFEPGVPPTFDFVANPGYTGPDRFVYRVMDDRGGVSNDAVVDVIIGEPPAQSQAQPLLPPDLRGPALALARPAGQKLTAVRRRGLKLRLTSDEAGLATVILSVTKRTARRFGIDRRATGPVVVGRGGKPLIAGDTTVVVKLSKRAKLRLAAARRVTLLATVLARDGFRNLTRKTLRVTLTR